MYFVDSYMGIDGRKKTLVNSFEIKLLTEMIRVAFLGYVTNDAIVVAHT